MINQEVDIIRVLIVSQDEEMMNKLTSCLTENAYETVTVSSRTDARKNLLSFQPHILLLDRQITSLNSLDLCREFHNACNIPILMLSSDDNIVDKVLALEIGCDDFMTKDFDARELLARIRSIVRRTHSTIPNFSALSGVPTSSDNDSAAKCLTFPGLIINLTNYSVTYRGATVDMPPRELELLYFLASSPNQVFTREQLLDHVWGYEYVGDTRTVDVHIKRLRAKLPGKNSWSLATVWGVGYKFQTKPSKSDE